MKTVIKPFEDIYTTSHIYSAIVDDFVLKLANANQCEKNSLYLNMVEFGEVNFERKSDWMRFINKLNRYDTTPLKRILVGDKKSSQWEGMKLTYLGNDEFQIDFDDEIELFSSKVGEQAVLVNIKSLKGKLTWEWLFRREGHEELGGYAGICDIWLTDVELLN